MGERLENLLNNGSLSNEVIIDTLTENIASLCDTSSSSNSNSTQSHNQHTEEIGEGSKKTSTDEKNGQKLKGDIDEAKIEIRDRSLNEDEIEIFRLEAMDIKNEGNLIIGAEHYDDAIACYTRGLEICPLQCNEERSMLYANRAVAYAKKDMFEEAIKDCTKAIEANPYYLKVFVRRAKLYESKERYEEAEDDYNKVLEMDPTNIFAIHGIKCIQEKISNRNERIKTEAISRFKELGDMLLRPFGLSTRNFKMSEGANGNYNINYESAAN